MITVTFAIAAFAVTAIGAGMVLLCAGISREESEISLRGKPPTLTTAVARRILGVYVRMPERPGQTGDAADEPDGNEARSPAARAANAA